MTCRHLSIVLVKSMKPQLHEATSGRKVREADGHAVANPCFRQKHITNKKKIKIICHHRVSGDLEHISNVYGMGKTQVSASDYQIK
jgi:hypothetical protein